MAAVGTTMGARTTASSPLTEGQPIRLGVIKTEPTEDVSRRHLAVWFECL